MAHEKLKADFVNSRTFDLPSKALPKESDIDVGYGQYHLR
jgi:hypothetical protein